MRIYSLQALSYSATNRNTKNNYAKQSSKSPSFGELNRKDLVFDDWVRNFDPPMKNKHPVRVPPARVMTPINQVIPPEVEALGLRELLKKDVPELHFVDIAEYCNKYRYKTKHKIKLPDGKEVMLYQYCARRISEVWDDVKEIKTKVLERAICDLDIFGRPGDRYLYGHTPDFRFCFTKSLDLGNLDCVDIYTNFDPTHSNRIMRFMTNKDRYDTAAIWDYEGNKAFLTNTSIEINDGPTIKALNYYDY